MAQTTLILIKYDFTMIFFGSLFAKRLFFAPVLDIILMMNFRSTGHQTVIMGVGVQVLMIYSLQLGYKGLLLLKVMFPSWPY